MKGNSKAVAPPREFWNGTAAICPYCKGLAALTRHGQPLYPYTKNFGPLWACDCAERAYVGVHRGTTVPLGRLANEELREARKAAHAAFDTIWMAKAKAGEKRHVARKTAYFKLAMAMGVQPSDCHIGWFDEAMCRRVTDYAMLKEFEAV